MSWAGATEELAAALGPSCTNALAFLRGGVAVRPSSRLGGVDAARSTCVEARVRPSRRGGGDAVSPSCTEALVRPSRRWGLSINASSSPSVSYRRDLLHLALRPSLVYP